MRSQNLLASISSKFAPPDPQPGCRIDAMAHALELFFDPTTEAEIKDVWARLEAAGLTSLATRSHRRHRPHVTLVVADRIETARLHDARERLAATHLDMTLYSPAVFQRSGVLYLSVVPTMALLRLHQEVHTALHDGLVASWGTYSVDAWVPHCTLAQGLTRAQLARGIDLLHDQPIVQTHVTSAGILDTKTGEVLPVATLRVHPS
jgi:2'-5' RNA ligase